MRAKRGKTRVLASVIRVLLQLILLVACLAVAGWFYLERWLHAPLGLPEEGYAYELKPGRALAHMAQDLAREGYLDQPRWLTLYARATKATHVHAGEYLLTPDLTPYSLLQKLQRGDVVLYQVTLLEGWTFAQTLAALHAKDTIKASLRDLPLEQQLDLLALSIDYPEGWFFPDTYSYSRATSDIEILRRAHQQMQQTLQALWDTRAENLPYQTPYQALIMASIVERETGAPWERDQVAGVFVRRLQQGMRLQTDPTVIYGMGSIYKGKITRKDLHTPTPYNTYTNRGLPPTPIAMPSRASIQAALNPADGHALYFVAKGDGTSYFSDTLAEHNRAVRRYQLQRRTDYRSTPALVPETNSESDSAR
jgi:UPF0755 protein